MHGITAITATILPLPPPDWSNALAAEVVKIGKVVANPYTKWIRDPRFRLRPIRTRPGSVLRQPSMAPAVFEEKVIAAAGAKCWCMRSSATEKGDEMAATGGLSALRTDRGKSSISTATAARRWPASSRPRTASACLVPSYYENNTSKLKARPSPSHARPELSPSRISCSPLFCVEETAYRRHSGG